MAWRAGGKFIVEVRGYVFIIKSISHHPSWTFSLYIQPHTSIIWLIDFFIYSVFLGGSGDSMIKSVSASRSVFRVHKTKGNDRLNQFIRPSCKKSHTYNGHFCFCSVPGTLFQLTILKGWHPSYIGSLENKKLSVNTESFLFHIYQSGIIFK